MRPPNPYDTEKLVYHPEVIDNLRRGNGATLVLVHLMPQNACNQRCNFCSYRLDGNKNSSEFDDTSSLKPDVLPRLAKDFEATGVKAVEVTGGGEPLAYKHCRKLFELLFSYGFEVGLVTNGTLLAGDLVPLLASNLAWLRVSIDAADAPTYARIRSTSASQFRRVLNGIGAIRSAGAHRKDFRLGAGFVLSNGNELQVYDFCALAKRLGADNVRLSMTFSDQGIDFFQDAARVEEAVAQAAQAERDLTDDGFQVVNQIPRRNQEIRESRNDYEHCYSKDVICVVEGSGKVYTCCTFAGSSRGVLGNILDHRDGFRGVWEDSQLFRKQLIPATYCQVPCLYKQKNLAMISLVHGDTPGVPEKSNPIHVNFI